MSSPFGVPSSDAPVVGAKLPTRIARLVALLLGLVGLLGSLSMLLMGLYARISIWSVAYLVTTALLGLALVVTGKPLRRWLLAGAGAGLCITAISRAVTARAANDAFAIITLPGASRAGPIASLVPESDGALLATAVLQMNDGGEPLGPVLQSAYARMERDLGNPPTPAIATYLGLQSPRSFDTIVIEPGAQQTRSAILFLHGFSGNFNVYCWQLAHAAKPSNTLVVCPSVGPVGDWWTPRGLLTVQTTIGYLRARGIEHIHLAGLSNGARGAAILAPHLVADIESLILISGASTNDPPPGLPLLVIQGERDAMMPPQLSMGYLSRATGPHSYVPLAGGHFVFLSHPDEVTGAIDAWLRARADSTNFQ